MTPSKKYLYSFTDEPNHSASKIVGLVGHDKKVLEVGCASGVQTRYMREVLSCSITGVEIDAVAAEDARPFCERLVIGNIEHLALSEMLGPEQFDVITFADVLEHLYDPTEVLRKVRPLLSKNGRILASIPNITHAAICWEIAHGRFDYQKFGLLDNTHIRFFSKKNVAKMFCDAGYEVVSWDRVIKSPTETEFSVTSGSDKEDDFLAWVQKNNPEANTYQFIVSAVPRAPESSTSDFIHLDNQDTIAKLEGRIAELTKQNSALSSQLRWLERHRFGPISGILNRMFK